MTRAFLTAAALTMIGAGTASAADRIIQPGTYSISLSPYCDHLTITVDSNGNAYGASDTSGCDQSPMAGSLAKLSIHRTVQPTNRVIQVSGDFGYGPTYAWNWDFNLKTNTGTLRGANGSALIFPPANFAITVQYSQTQQGGLHANNGGRSVTSVLLRK